MQVLRCQLVSVHLYQFHAKCPSQAWNVCAPRRRVLSFVAEIGCISFVLADEHMSPQLIQRLREAYFANSEPVAGAYSAAFAAKP